MKIRTSLCLAPFALAALVGCLRTPGGIAASTTPLEGRAYEVLGEAYGSGTQVHILGIIPAGRAVETQTAVDDAKRKAGADALIEVTVDRYTKDFVLWTTVTTEVRGKAIRFKK